ncbi:NADH:ubiquinone oxidoreductase subunit E [Anaerotaenia torta]|uniref:(2Fe-2S) ferredoxin domain-containing protein n=1 Tax=Anaerotaenia torta TaxID=433293 RepID=UPI003D194BB9
MMEVKICIGTSCHLNGSYNVIQSIQQLLEEYSLHDMVKLEAYFCMKQCQSKGVSITIDGTNYRVEPENARTFFLEQIKSLKSGK